MSRLVIDTSVAVKWFVPEDHSEHARKLLDNDHALLVPDLLYPEFGNVLWKRARAGEMSEEESLAVVEALLRIPLEVHSSSMLLAPALEIAHRTQRTVYDSIYLALAVHENAVLVTADERLLNAVQGTPVARHVAHVAAVA